LLRRRLAVCGSAERVYGLDRLDDHGRCKSTSIVCRLRDATVNAKPVADEHDGIAVPANGTTGNDVEVIRGHANQHDVAALIGLPTKSTVESE